MDNFKALREARKLPYLNDGSVGDYGATTHPRCPHCGELINAIDHDLCHLYSEGEHDVECPHCDKPFSVDVEVTYSFTTSDADRDCDDEQPTGEQQ